MAYLVKLFVSVFLGLTVLFATFFSVAQPMLTSAASTSSFNILSLTVTSGIAITGSNSTTLSRPLSLTANSAIGTSSLTVITTDVNGYTLTVQATSSPAMRNTASTTMTVTDYQTGPPNTWSATTSNAYFGYSAFGGDIPTGTWGTGSGCNGGIDPNATSTTLKYKGFTMSPVTIASSNSSSAGTPSTICYAVEQKNYFIPVRAGQASDMYQATISVTATEN
jgi:hypothetical protein